MFLVFIINSVNAERLYCTLSGYSGWYYDVPSSGACWGSGCSVSGCYDGGSKCCCTTTCSSHNSPNCVDPAWWSGQVYCFTPPCDPSCPSLSSYSCGQAVYGGCSNYCGTGTYCPTGYTGNRFCSADNRTVLQQYITNAGTCSSGSCIGTVTENRVIDTCDLTEKCDTSTTTCRQYYTYCNDRDGDGRGTTDPSEWIESFSATVPPGNSSYCDDCDDSIAMVYLGASEACNDRDDDCDTVIDDGLSLTSRCSQVGECNGAISTCNAGVWSICSKVPSSEICDGKDNDCNGINDDNNVCCGAANGEYYSSTPPAGSLCDSGSAASGVTFSEGDYTWTCTKSGVVSSCIAYSSGNDATLSAIGEYKKNRTSSFVIVSLNNCGMPNSGNSVDPYVTTCELHNFDQTHCCAGNTCTDSGAIDTIVDRDGLWYYSSAFDASKNSLDNPSDAKKRKFAFSCAPLCQKYDTCAAVGAINGNCTLRNETAGNQPADIEHEGYWSCDGDDTGGMHCNGTGGCVSDCKDVDTDGYGIEPDGNFHAISCTAHSANIDCNDANWYVKPITGKDICNGIDDDCDGVIDNRVYGGGVARDACGKVTGKCASGFDYYSIPDVRPYSNNSVYIYLSDYSKYCNMSASYIMRISTELYNGLFPTYLSGANYHFNTTQSVVFSNTGIKFNNLSNCLISILGRRPLATDIFHVIPRARNINNQPYEGNFWTPGYGSWFTNSSSFTGLELNFSPETETGAKCANGGDDDCDGESDYDNQIWNSGTPTGIFKTEHGDNDCPVGIDSVSASNAKPLLNSFINVTCDVSVGYVNSVFVYIDYNKDRKYSSRTDYICEWNSNSKWIADKAIFADCQVQQEGIYNISCSVYNNSVTKPFDRSYQTGPDKFTQINVTLCPNGTRWIAPNVCENITANCSNGVIDIGEECDGSNFWLYDSCSDIIPGSTGTLTCNSQCKIDYNCLVDQRCDNDGIAEMNESCDNNDFKGKTCFDFGYLNGNLRCNRDCTIDTGNCSNSSFNDIKCPNGVIDDATEKCDTNQFGTETCDTLFPGTTGRLNCTPSCAIEPHCKSVQILCSNDNVELGEVCDGTDLNGENCTSLGFDTGELFCNSDCTLNTSKCYYIINPKCPNGIIDAGEECDTNAFTTTCQSYGFTYGNLGCTINCTVDYSQCYNSQPPDFDICGDGHMNASRGEECDGSDFGALGASCTRANYDAGLLNCTTACKIDTKNCYDLIIDENCPNGVIDLGENCDGGIPNDLTCEDYNYKNGNLRCVNCEIDYSECYNDTIEEEEYCGDEIIQAGLGETCDTLNLNSKDCTDFGFDAGSLFCDRTKCIIDTSRCYDNINPPQPACGDGKIDAGEQCDGVGTFTSSCAAAYPGRFDAGTITCVNCMLNTNSCTKSSPCNNNGLIDLPSEACDGTDYGGQTCATMGLGSGSLTCTNCVIGTSACSITPILPLCGNNIVDAGETCDTNTYKTCQDFNMQNGFVYCNSTCQLVTNGCYNNTIGCNNDGIVDPGETCDGGAGSWRCEDFGFTGNGPISCNNCQLNVSRCKRIIPYIIITDGEIISFPEMYCNYNGICEDSESCACTDCDDKQDHCDAGLKCSNKVCSPTTCHDGILDLGEECDDNNWNDNDACANCMNATCGDGYRWFGYEECDLGVSLNGVPGTKCSIDCFNLSKGFNLNRQLVKNYSNFEAANAVDPLYTQKVRYHLLSADLKRKPIDYLIANPFFYFNSKNYEGYISPDECFNSLKPGETCLQLWFVNITDTTDREIIYLPEDSGITLVNPLNFTAEFNNTMVSSSKTPELRIKIIPWENKFIPGGKGVIRTRPKADVYNWTWANKTAYDANPGASGLWTCKDDYHVNDSTEPYNAPKDCIPNDIVRPN